MKKTGALSIILFLKICCSAQFTITGNPESLNGATWTYNATINSITYDLTGILFKPIGTGPFSAVIINHGTGGNVTSYSKNVAKEMVEWGYVCIATNYTHAGGLVACGAPGNCCDPAFCGTSSEWGASTSNILRGKKCYDLLRTLNYVDSTCVMSFGHSRGAFVTTALVATYPTKFKAAAHTAGGVTTQTNTLAPTSTLAAGITCPYLMHHGDADNTVLLSMDNLLADVFMNTGTIHQLLVYPAYSHSAIAQDSAMYAQTKEWFSTYGCSSSLPVEIISFTGKRSNNLCSLNWISADSKDVLYYELERSSVSIQLFENVTIKKPNNNCFSTCELSHEDFLPSSLQNEKVYYRLKIHLRNGSMEYSNAIALLPDDLSNINNTVKIFPNPKTDNDILSVECVKGKIESIAIMNTEGKIIQEIKGIKKETYLLSPNSLMKGFYIVQVITSEGELYYLRGISTGQ